MISLVPLILAWEGSVPSSYVGEANTAQPIACVLALHTPHCSIKLRPKEE